VFLCFVMVALVYELGRWGLGFAFVIVLATMIWASRLPVPAPPPPSDQELGDELNAFVGLGQSKNAAVSGPRPADGDTSNSP
jgi:hypothetical protein